MQPPVSQDAVIRFGVFEADLRSSELRKCGARVKIQELPFQALKIFLTHPNEIINRDQLRSALWPDDVFVDFDRGIISAVNRLRDALGDSAENPVYIETVGRRGYRWIAHTLGPERPPEAVVQPIPEAAPIAPPHSLSWKWLLVVPVLVIFVTGGIYRMNRRSGNASSITAQSLSISTAPRHPANRESEDFYLKGRFYWNQRTPESLNKAVDSFTQAIVHDPTYAPAYVGLADCYNLLREYSVMPASEAYPRALAAAKKATELDDRSSEAHASLAFVSFNWLWDTATADREFRRAIELDPKNGIAHHWYATSLLALGRYPEAMPEMERAQALDPASKSILADKGRLLWLLGRHDEALALLQQMEVAEPTFLSPHRYLKVAYLESGDYPHYLAELKHEALLLRDSAALTVADAAARGFSSGGAQGMFLGQMRAQKKLYEQGQISPLLLADTCALLGDKQEALKYLEAAYTKRSDGFVGIETDRTLDSLHDEPAYRQLLARMKQQPLT